MCNICSDFHGVRVGLTIGFPHNTYITLAEYLMLDCSLVDEHRTGPLLLTTDKNSAINQRTVGAGVLVLEVFSWFY